MRRSVLGLFPPGVRGAELTELPSRSTLWPEEEAAVARASNARAREFAAGRLCARAALGQIGHAPTGIPRLPGDAPGWPAGIIGSLSHTSGYCGAVVAWRRELGTVGFDVERRGSVSSAVLAEIASDAEVAMLARESTRGVAEMATVLFSAKESFYKAHHQAYGSALDFLDATFRVLGPDRFEITPCDRPNAPAEWSAPRTGSYRIDERHVFTAMVWQLDRVDAPRACP